MFFSISQHCCPGAARLILECAVEPRTGASRVLHLTYSVPTFVGQTSLGFALYNAELFLDEAANCCPATDGRNLFRTGGLLVVCFGANFMPLIHVNRCNLKYRRGLNGRSLWAMLVALIYACGLASCGDTDNVSPPPAGPGPLTIVTNSPLSSGTVNQPYATALGGSGGITPYTWSLASGSPALPAGLSLDDTAGTITGKPTAPGTTTPIFRLEDSSSPEQAVQEALTITITLTPQPLVISTSSLPEGTVNQPYNPTTLQATGGIQPYTWSVNPALPNGLQLNVLSPGTITGTPLNGTGGTTTHTFTVADSDAPINQTTTTQLSLKINPAPAPVEITSPAGNFLPNARVGKKYSTTLNGSGGVPPYTWSITPALPTGLLLNTSTGEITGKPSKDTSGIYFLTIMVQDSSPPTNQSTNKPVTLTVRP